MVLKRRGSGQQLSFNPPKENKDATVSDPITKACLLGVFRALVSMFDSHFSNAR